MQKPIYLSLHNWIQAPKLEPTLELHSRAAPSVEAHHGIDDPDTGKNSGGRRIKKNNDDIIADLLR